MAHQGGGAWRGRFNPRPMRNFGEGRRPQASTSSGGGESLQGIGGGAPGDQAQAMAARGGTKQQYRPVQHKEPAKETEKGDTPVPQPEQPLQSNPRAGFTQQFKWNWQWKAKAMPNGTFQLRFPNKIKFEELSNFDYFNVKGTDVQVNVKEWTQESDAVGKMHTAWVKVSGIPDAMRGYQALYEVGSNLGTVMEVDMATFRASNVIRFKVGMMELDSLPLKLILTTPKGLLYQAHFELDEVVEQGWFNESIFEEV
ncbi:hypothetical protein OsJ_34355 [Oryza sativa Japonica Group]|uniref:Uncharacterized protein n=1 Tax=Oryza sativa subsp. japonica TaxID=39947 RepID=A3CCK6_ORYSJ|nr:hypothetical protein OsJ_34355 [Oryza sativa Japonica Group]